MGAGSSGSEVAWSRRHVMELRHDSVQCQRRVLLQVWLSKVTGSGFHYTIAIAILEMPPKCNHTHMETHSIRTDR